MVIWVGRIVAVAASLAGVLVPVGAAWIVWVVDPRGWLPAALLVAFILWCIWARVEHPAGAFARSGLWLLLAAGVAWNPVLAGVAPVWAVPMFLGVFAIHWLAALRKHGVFPIVRLSDDVADGDVADEDEHPRGRRVRDLTVAHQPPRDAPIAARQVVTLHPDRYADVTIDGPDDDSSGPLSFLDEVAALFPDRRRTDTGRVLLRDVADALGLDADEVSARLAEEDVEAVKQGSVRPLAGGLPTDAPSVRWAALQAAGCATACATA